MSAQFPLQSLGQSVACSSRIPKRHCMVGLPPRPITSRIYLIYFDQGEIWTGVYAQKTNILTTWLCIVLYNTNTYSRNFLNAEIKYSMKTNISNSYNFMNQTKDLISFLNLKCIILNQNCNRYKIKGWWQSQCNYKVIFIYQILK